MAHLLGQRLQIMVRSEGTASTHSHGFSQHAPNMKMWTLNGLRTTQRAKLRDLTFRAIDEGGCLREGLCLVLGSRWLNRLRNL